MMFSEMMYYAETAGFPVSREGKINKVINTVAAFPNDIVSCEELDAAFESCGIDSSTVSNKEMMKVYKEGLLNKGKRLI